MDIRTVVTAFAGAEPLTGLEDAWRWARNPRLHFAGALSGDGKRLLQLRVADVLDPELAVAALGFAREHEEEFFASNPCLGAVGGFSVPGYTYDSVAAVAPEVHRFYARDNPELMPLVRLIIPAYACEFSGQETEPEAVSRYKMLGKERSVNRGPVPFLRMRYINTKTKGRSAGTDRGFAEEQTLERELRQMEDGEGSIVEFENRHGQAWRVMWSEGTWLLAAWDETQRGTPQATEIDDLVSFAGARLRE